ncbi:DUF2339 domain-containing protein [Prosthecomicrobium sp. N25]|uniref:DUF2339 domain-containing protein n=1 Tax=Prosthecomicrobium sp. N25 TaxID=3129254 RepID=UPI0030778598
MDGLFAIGILLLIALPVMAFAGFFIALGARRGVTETRDQTHRIEQALNAVARRVDELDRRLGRLETGAPRPAGEAAAAPAPLPSEAPTPTGEAVPGPAPDAEAERRRRAAALFEAADRTRKTRETAPAGEPGEPAEAASGGAPGPDLPLVAGTVPPVAPRPAAPGRGLEETLGTRWTVWIGGLALALGGIFMVKYSIEQGYFGPAARIAMAGLFAAALLAAGEYLRRHELARPIGGLDVAYIPGILTAAGTVAAFATVYGAHALYGFVGAGPAFLLLGAVGLGAMALALLHGPWLAVLGVLGGYATPALVSSEAPNLPALVLYLLVVTASAFGIARLKLWRWVAAVALAFAVLWGLPILDTLGRPDPRTLWYIGYVAGLLALVAGVLVVSIHGLSPVVEDKATDRFAILALSLVALLALFGQWQDEHGLSSRLLAGATVLTGFGLAWRVNGVAPAVLVSGLFALASVLGWQVHVAPTLWEDTFARGADGLVALRPRIIADFLAVAITAGLLHLAIGFLGALRGTPEADRNAGWFALAGTLPPVLGLVVVWLRVEGWEPSFAYATAGLALSAVFAAAAGRLVRVERPDHPSRAVAVYVVGSVAALGAGLAIGLDRGALTIALALIVPALAWVHRARPIPTLRPLAALVGLAVLARVLWDPRIVGDDLGTTPVFNWLLYGYGIPAAGFAFAAWTFRRSGDDVWQRALEALAVIFAGLLALFEIRHAVNAGDVFAPSTSVEEVGLVATVGFLMSAGLGRLAGRLNSVVYDTASMTLTAVGGVVAVVGLLLAQNPLVTGDSIGEGVFFNGLLLGYLLPAAAAGLAARLARIGRPRWYAGLLAGIALLLGFAWVTLMVRRAYHGPVLAYGPEPDAELWAYSAVWLAYGVAMLVAGLVLRSQPARLASAGIIVLTVLKVFLIDMSAITGFWRALSFIALGLVLVGIGMLYQRLLFPPARGPGQGGAAADGGPEPGGGPEG